MSDETTETNIELATDEAVEKAVMPKLVSYIYGIYQKVSRRIGKQPKSETSESDEAMQKQAEIGFTTGAKFTHVAVFAKPKAAITSVPTKPESFIRLAAAA